VSDTLAAGGKADITMLSADDQKQAWSSKTDGRGTAGDVSVGLRFPIPKALSLNSIG
jgi:hypothetical protein